MSLVDLVPMLLDLAGEYLGEGAIAPIFMIRRSPWKFIHLPVDPDQLYDLSADPDGRFNCADDPAHADLVSALRSEVEVCWNLRAIETDVLTSQLRRHRRGKRRGAYPCMQPTGRFF